MRYRKLGSSDLEVSEISLGAWLTYAGGIEFEQTRACTEAAFDAGINFFDTANVYGRGAAETAWGEILSKHPRDSYILATKVNGQMSDDPERPGPVGGADRQADRRLARAPADRLRRPLPGAPLRRRRADRGDDRGAAAGRRAGQGALPRLQRMDARADRGRGRNRRAGPVRLLPAAVLDAVAGARGRALRGLRALRHLAHRLVAARAGRADRQVQARRSPSRGLARRKRTR